MANVEAAKKSPRFLRDEPSEVDTMGGGHDRVAKAISEAITDEQGAWAIALTGPFGSGKSTVIRLISRHLLASKRDGATSTAVFTFDAWAHRGDPLRRAFLEELVDFLCDPVRRWVSEERWRKELRLLSGRQEIQDVTTEPRLTRHGGHMAASLLLVPIGLGVISLANGDDLSGLLLTIGLLLTASPFVVVTKAYIQLKRSLAKHAAFATLHSSPINDDKDNAKDATSVFSLFIQHEHHESRITTTRTIDPTTIEFKRLYQRLLTEALSVDDRRILLVIDNLDRLSSPNEIMEVWATMRAFFERVGSGTEWEPRVWMLAPFDDHRLKAAWPSQIDADAKRVQPDQPVTLDPAPDPDRSPIALSTLGEFISKTFQVVVRVPPPVLSDWREHFTSLLHEAFGDNTDIDEDEFYAIYRLYQQERVSGHGPPTPRQLKSFINRLVSLAQQWRNRFPLRSLALYLLKEDYIGANAPQLKNKDWLIAPTRILVTPDWQRHLAALHFNVDPNKAIQVLIGDEVDTALRSGQLAVPEAHRSVPGFFDVLQEALTSIAADGESRTIALAGRALEGIKPSEPNPGYRNAWRYLSGAANVIETWDVESQEIGEGIVNIMDNEREGTRLQRIETAVVKSLAHSRVTVDGADEAGERLLPAAGWVKAVLPIARSLHMRDRAELLNEEWRVPGDGSAYLAALAAVAASSDNRDLAQYFKTHLENTEVVKALRSISAQGLLALPHAHAIQLLKEIEGDSAFLEWPWDSIVPSLKTQLDMVDGTTPTLEEVSSSVIILTIIAESKKGNAAREALRELSRSSLLHHLHYFKTDTNTFSTLLSVILMHNPTGEVTNAVGRANKGGQVFVDSVNDEQLDDTIVSSSAVIADTFGWSDEILDTISKHLNGKVYFSRIVEKWIEGDTAVSAISSASFIQYYKTLEDCLSENTIKALTESLVYKGDLIIYLENEVSVTELPPDLDMQMRSIGIDDIVQRYHKYIHSQMLRLSRDEWRSAIANTSAIIRIVFHRLEMGDSPDLGTPLADSLMEHAKAIINDDVYPPDIEGWHLFVDALDPNTRETFLRDMVGLLSSNTVNGTAHVLSLYHDTLVERAPWAEKSDEAVRNLFSDIVNNGDEHCVTWLLSLARAQSNSIRSAKKASKESLGDRIITRLDHGGDDNVKDLLVELLQIFDKRRFRDWHAQRGSSGDDALEQD